MFTVETLFWKCVHLYYNAAYIWLYTMLQVFLLSHSISVSIVIIELAYMCYFLWFLCNWCGSDESLSD